MLQAHKTGVDTAVGATKYGQFRTIQALACTWLSIIFLMYEDNPKEIKFRRLPLGQIKLLSAEGFVRSASFSPTST